MEIMPVIQWMQHHSIVAMMALFLVIFGLTYWPTQKSRIERFGKIPLEDDR
jgi:hypothetical protein